MAGDELGGMVTRERLRVSEFIHGGGYPGDDAHW